nr:hypothetical protein Iba_chr04cCG17850 [Ipomoea batatas]
MKSLELLSLQVRITIEVPSPDALSNVIFEDQEERHVKDAGYQAPHLLNWRIASFSNSSTSKVSETIRVFKQKGIPSAIIHPFVVVVDSVIRDFVDSGLDPLQFKSKPSPSSQVLDGSVFVLHPIAQTFIGSATSKAELELVKNIFSVIHQLPDYLHPFLNFRIDFFRLVRNFQNRSQTMKSILDVLRIISNPSQERVLFTAQR